MDMPKKKELTFAAAYEELESITAWFESDEMELEAALKKFERGLELAAVCKKSLATIENTITDLKKQHGL